LVHSLHLFYNDNNFCKEFETPDITEFGAVSENYEGMAAENGVCVVLVRHVYPNWQGSDNSAKKSYIFLHILNFAN
jgi:hypothetical protein